MRWKNYGSDEDSWEPEQNLKTARLILDEYIRSHQNEVKEAQDAVLPRNKLRKRCGNRIKLRNKVNSFEIKHSSIIAVVFTFRISKESCVSVALPNQRFHLVMNRND